METAELLGTLDREGRLLAEAAEAAGTDARVPSCPGWRVRDLLRHTGAVHLWATGVVAEVHTARPAMGDPPDLDGADLLAWYRAAHRRLVQTLAEAPGDVRCWTFHPAPSPSPLAFWIRRQAHETAVHRFDAESARGGAPTAVDTGFAVDGIDELLRGFHARSRSRVRTEEPRVLRVRATATATTPGAGAHAGAGGTGDAAGAGGDGGASGTVAVWTVRLSQEPPVTVPGASEEADAELAGPADQLYLALWNRVPVPETTGDPALAALWRQTSAI
ncbi:maleylpyruvate isomerase family mycothiol-dependent enzyme [Streptomyces mexicanus]|uniref:maleylpyruvate isomerase family mycothiol-dependent enzyme n=1 Tax=Streptomyces mexicanus TaxID=178566 RepID=UPI0036843425